MDWQKLATYVSSLTSSILGILVVTNNMGDNQANVIAVAVSSVLAAIAGIFAANSGPKVN